MRLLNTAKLCFEHVPDSELSGEKNQYAILSHRWGVAAGEVTFEDISTQAVITHKKGYEKVKGFCDMALSMGCQYGWVDTSCINRSDFTELTEAINSMYRWYRGSKVCLAFLEDVPGKPLEESEWFDRGWTLQELIAPKNVSFFDRNWKIIGTKAEMTQRISSVTKIPASILDHTANLASCSVAQRMSWAATRKTTRVEDQAYSLLGLFEVDMPLIYGERERAFLRLQQCIVQRYKDESIFAWEMAGPHHIKRECVSLYAPSPSSFESCSDVVCIPGSKGFQESQGELTITLRLERVSNCFFAAPLHCTLSSHPDHMLGILVVKTVNRDEYFRGIDSTGISRWMCDRVSSDGGRRMIFPATPATPAPTIFFGFWLRTLQIPAYDHHRIHILSQSPANEPDYIHQDIMANRTGIVYFEPKDVSATSSWSSIQWMEFGFAPSLQPLMFLANDTHSERLRPQFMAAIDKRSPANCSAREEKTSWESISSGLKWKQDYFETSALSYDWPEGRALVYDPSKRGLNQLVLDTLGVQISLKLQPYRSPMAKNTNDRRDYLVAPEPTSIWAVDITSIDEPKTVHQSRSSNVSQLCLYSRELARHAWGGASCHICWFHTICASISGCYLCGFGTFPCLYKDNHAYKRHERENEEIYRERARSRIPWLHPNARDDLSEPVGWAFPGYRGLGMSYHNLDDFDKGKVVFYGGNYSRVATLSDIKRRQTRS